MIVSNKIWTFRTVHQVKGQTLLPRCSQSDSDVTWVELHHKPEGGFLSSQRLPLLWRIWTWNFKIVQLALIRGFKRFFFRRNHNILRSRSTAWWTRLPWGSTIVNHCWNSWDWTWKMIRFRPPLIWNTRHHQTVSWQVYSWKVLCHLSIKVTLLWVNTPLPPKIWNVTKATTKTRRTGSWTVWDPLICFPVIHFYYHDIQLQIKHYNYIILYTVSTVSALVGIALVHHVQNDGFQWVLRLKWSNVGWFGIPLWHRTPQNRCPKVGNFTGSAIYHSFFFLFIFLQPHGHVPKHNHLSLSLSRSGTVQNNVSEGSPKIWRIQMNPIYPRFCSFKQLTHFRPCVHHKSKITCWESSR